MSHTVPFPVEIVYRFRCAICGAIEEQLTQGDYVGAEVLQPWWPDSDNQRWRIIHDGWVCPKHAVDQNLTIDGVDGFFEVRDGRKQFIRL